MSEADVGHVIHCDAHRLELDVNLTPGQVGLDYRVGRKVHIITDEHVRDIDQEVREGINRELDDAVSEAKYDAMREQGDAVEGPLDALDELIEKSLPDGRTRDEINKHIAAIRKALP